MESGSLNGLPAVATLRGPMQVPSNLRESIKTHALSWRSQEKTMGKGHEVLSDCSAIRGSLVLSDSKLENTTKSNSVAIDSDDIFNSLRFSASVRV